MITPAAHRSSTVGMTMRVMLTARSNRLCVAASLG